MNNRVWPDYNAIIPTVKSVRDPGSPILRLLSSQSDILSNNESLENTTQSLGNIQVRCMFTTTGNSKRNESGKSLASMAIV